MTVGDWLTMFSELNSYMVRICIFDLRVGKCVWNSANCEPLDLIAEVADGDYENYDLLSVGMDLDCDGTICLDLHIETEEEDDE